jgi:hypothetical protein
VRAEQRAALTGGQTWCGRWCAICSTGTATRCCAGVDQWPTDQQWDALRKVDTLRAEPADARERDGSTMLELELPHPGAVLVEVGPER